MLKSRTKKQFTFQLVVILFMITLFSFSVFGLSVTRSISENKVTLTVDPSGGTGTMSIQETVTGSLVVTEMPGECKFAPTKKRLTCDYEKASSGTIVYSTSGSGSVSGIVVSGSQQVNVAGDSTIPKTSACVSDWQQGAWSTCLNGQQTRTVTDSNNCPVPTNKPATSKTCTVTPSSSDCANLCDADQQSCLDEGYGEIDCTSTYNSCIAACPTTNGAQCGNNIKEGTEVCDGPDLGGQTCMSINPANVGGFLTCSSDCKGIKTSNCVQSSNQLLTCVDSDTIAVNDAKEGVSYPTSYKYINLNDKGSVTFKNATGVVVGAAEPDSCDPVTGKVVERFCDDKGNLAKEEIACPTGKSCVGGACVSSGADVGGEIQVTAKDQQESYLFQRIHDALEKNSGSPLKQISSVAGVFQCYFDSSCKLGEYKVK